MDTVLKESDIQKQILQYLQYKGVFNWRNNTGAMKTKYGFVRFGVAGAPDIFALKAGVMWGIEVKRPKGKQSELQKHWGDQFIKAGGKYVVVYSLDDVMAIL